LITEPRISPYGALAIIVIPRYSLGDGGLAPVTRDSKDLGLGGGVGAKPLGWGSGRAPAPPKNALYILDI